MSHLRRRLPYPLLLAASAVALLLPRLPARAQVEPLPPPDVQALGVPLDQLPQAAALLQIELDKLKASGEPLRREDLVPPVPDEENAALVYLQAFAAVRFGPPQPPPAPAAPVVPPPVQPGAAGPPPPDENAPAPKPPPPPPPPPPPAPGAGGAPPAGEAAAPGPPAMMPLPVRPAAVDEEQYVVGNAVALALLEKAASLPKCQFPLDWSDPAGLRFPHDQWLEDSVVLLNMAGDWEARRGDADEALRLCGVGVAMSRATEGEPSTTPVYLSYENRLIALEGLRNILGLQSPYEAPNLAGLRLPSTAACRKLYDQLGQIDRRTPLRRALLGTRAQMLWCYQEARDKPMGLAYLFDRPLGDVGTIPDPRFMDWVAFWVTPTGRQVLALDEVAYLRDRARVFAALDRPWRELADSAPPFEAFPPYCILARGATGMARLFMSRDRDAAAAARAQIALALIACHNETGQWPATLDQLHKVVGWDLPLDPFSGKDFIYRREGEGWVLYSVGPNLKDDGGTGDDMVWRRK